MERERVVQGRALEANDMIYVEIFMSGFLLGCGLMAYMTSDYE